MKHGWLIVPLLAVLSWCSTRVAPVDGGSRDGTPDGAHIEPLCGRVCAHFEAGYCPQTDCQDRCRQTWVMAGDLCVQLYENYLACAANAQILCTTGGALGVVGCDPAHVAATNCMGGPSDGGL